MENVFSIDKYLGMWYQLACYPSWYSPPVSYNTTAFYENAGDGTITVTNSTVVNGIKHQSVGRARRVGDTALHVEFPMESRKAISLAFDTIPTQPTSDVANYVIYKIWVVDSRYEYAIVTDMSKSQFYLLSRSPSPSADTYAFLMHYASDHFDSDRIVHTPHYS